MIGVWHTLAQFVFRLTFGVALAMAVTPSRLVTSGYYRVHLWVLMGLNTFGALVLYSNRSLFENWSTVFPLAIATAAICYLGAVIWLYEKARLGVAVLWTVAVLAVLGAILATAWPRSATGVGVCLALLDMMSGGVLMGVTLAAMFLGHWYLNTPTMDLLPLRRLVCLMAVAVVARTILCTIGVGLQWHSADEMAKLFWVFVVFRWLSGLLGVSMVALLAWETLKVPNTQSATGLLYAGVILTFIGELTSQVLSVSATYPV